MDEHVRRLRKEDLLTDHGGWFDVENAERVVTWLVAAEKLRPVVLVGAGFSRNALDAATGKPARDDQVPLWWDVAKRLAQDLGVSASRYDAPTLFEMYREAFGETKLREALRATIADDDLVPGAAHEALANYDAVAIVTMNCLDTLLDKACRGHWRRIVEDTDLSAADAKSELIYLHGHRDRPDSWVMTRNQYEDLPRKKPIIMSRVRQLLAQHPWLVVGYSLTDIDFHAVTRLVSLEMKGFSPLSLVLARDAPSAPERQHWRGLGFEIANPTLEHPPGTPRSMGDFLAWSCRNLGTSYLATAEAVRRYVARGRTKAERLARYREANSRDVRADRALRDWTALLAGLLTDEQRTLSKAHAHAVSQASYTRRFGTPKEAARTEAPQPSEPDVPRLHDPLLKISEIPRFSELREQEVVWQIHYLLDDREIRGELVEHFAWALKRELFQEAHPSWLLDVVTMRLAQDAGWARERLQEVVLGALEVARRYEDETAEELIGGEAALLKCTVPSKDEISQHEYVGLALSAYRSFMNADFAAAAADYSKAAKEAAAAERNFGVWLYTYGQATALQRLAHAPEQDDDGRTGFEVEARAIFEEVRRLEQGEEMAHWLGQARSRTETLFKELIDEHLDRSRHRDTGNTGMRFSSAAHYAWRTYREVAFVFGPPPLQRRYLGPLVPYLNLDHLSEAMSHAPKPKVWLDDSLREWRGSVEERKLRDERIVTAFFNEKADSRTELVARLECLPSIRSVLRRGDGERAFSWLLNCAKRVGAGWLTTADGTCSVDGYWKAFSIIARWSGVGPESVLEHARALRTQLAGRGGSALEALYELPWFAWRLDGGPVAQGYVSLLCEHLEARRDALGRDGAREVSNAIFALRRMLEAGLDSSLVRVRLDLVQRVLDEMKAARLEATSAAEGKRAGLLLERKLIEAGLGSEREVTALFEDWFPKDNEVESTDHRVHREIWVVLAELLEAKELSEELNGRLREELKRILAPARRRFWELNPHSGYAPKRLLIASMGRFIDMREDNEEFLLSLFSSAPNNLNLLAPVLDTECWSSEGWARATHIILAACGGTVLKPSERADDGLSARAQFEVLDLCASVNATALREAALTRYAMQALALSSATDERISVANHAAFAVVKLAMGVEAEEEARMFAATLRRMANDPRVPVRLALADGGPALSSRAKSLLVRRAADEALDIVRSDDNAQLSWALETASRTEADQCPGAGDEPT